MARKTKKDGEAPKTNTEGKYTVYHFETSSTNNNRRRNQRFSNKWKEELSKVPFSKEELQSIATTTTGNHRYNPLQKNLTQLLTVQSLVNHSNHSNSNTPSMNQLLFHNTQQNQFNQLDNTNTNTTTTNPAAPSNTNTNTNYMSLQHQVNSAHTTNALPHINTSVRTHIHSHSAPNPLETFNPKRHSWHPNSTHSPLSLHSLHNGTYSSLNNTTDPSSSLRQHQYASASTSAPGVTSTQTYSPSLSSKRFSESPVSTQSNTSHHARHHLHRSVGATTSTTSGSPIQQDNIFAQLQGLNIRDDKELLENLMNLERSTSITKRNSSNHTTSKRSSFNSTSAVRKPIRTRTRPLSINHENKVIGLLPSQSTHHPSSTPTNTNTNVDTSSSTVSHQHATSEINMTDYMRSDLDEDPNYEVHSILNHHQHQHQDDQKQNQNENQQSQPFLDNNMSTNEQINKREQYAQSLEKLRRDIEKIQQINQQYNHANQYLLNSINQNSSILSQYNSMVDVSEMTPEQIQLNQQINAFLSQLPSNQSSLHNNNNTDNNNTDNNNTDNNANNTPHVDSNQNITVEETENSGYTSTHQHSPIDDHFLFDSPMDSSIPTIYPQADSSTFNPQNGNYISQHGNNYTPSSMEQQQQHTEHRKESLDLEKLLQSILEPNK